MKKKDKYQIMVMKDKTNRSKIKHDLFDLPCRMCICGKSGTGKTSLLSLLIIDPNNEFYRGRWAPEDIFLFSGSYKTDNKIQKMVEHLSIPEENVFEQYDNEVLKVIYSQIESRVKEALDDNKKIPHSLIILDDLTYSKEIKQDRNDNQLNRIFSNGRKNCISCIVIQQTFLSLLPSVRENANAFILYNCSNRELEAIETQNNYLGSKRQFMKMFRSVVQERHDFLAISYSRPFKTMYMDKNFETIDVDKHRD